MSPFSPLALTENSLPHYGQLCFHRQNGPYFTVAKAQLSASWGSELPLTDFTGKSCLFHRRVTEMIARSIFTVQPIVAHFSLAPPPPIYICISTTPRSPDFDIVFLEQRNLVHVTCGERGNLRGGKHTYKFDHAPFLTLQLALFNGGKF